MCLEIRDLKNFINLSDRNRMLGRLLLITLYRIVTFFEVTSIYSKVIPQCRHICLREQQAAGTIHLGSGFITLGSSQ